MLVGLILNTLALVFDIGYIIGRDIIIINELGGISRMSFTKLTSPIRRDQGFTIVELLIVIVVIAILAAITIVAYNGITAQANTTASQATASSFIKKAEAYNAEQGSYPTTRAQLTGAASNKSYQMPSSSFTALGSTPSSAPSNNNSIYIQACGSGAGVRVYYWNYSTSASVNLTAGTISSCATMAAS
ncbi:hypothetical protein CL689_00060 [Candidatus Saccharibacteria bacterium]|nr:hypothetical protein [Candidatus Saccharibacteria bacterium]MBJ58132.1 hypothetical protein [Candidatus Saccharibacteria bacterium]MBQ68447.1 hypothetical protein [Candidatus Saccharibacteria bacterium]|tara:strand:- start:88 stop:651 length:564 start_codon:yes stop_codon:yes gene_type:complete